MDRIDRVLLALIQRDGRKPYAQLGAGVGLSAPAVHERLNKLREAGILCHWSAAISPDAAGYPVLAFVRVQTDMPANAQGLAAEIGSLPEVQEIHHIGGEWNCLVKIRAATPQALDELVSARIATQPGILRLQVERVTSTSKETSFVPTDQPVLSV